MSSHRTRNRIIPIPAQVLASPLFTGHEDLCMLYEEHGGLPLPLKHTATLEVIAFMAAVKAHEPENASVVDEWGAAVLGIPSPVTSPVTSPVQRSTSLPGSGSPSPGTASGNRSPFIPVSIIPEIEPETENHALYPTVHASTPGRFVPVPINPEVDPGRKTPMSPRSQASPLAGSPGNSPPLSSSPSFASIHSASGGSNSLSQSQSQAYTPGNQAHMYSYSKKTQATGYFPLQGTKKGSPLSSPPVLPDENAALGALGLGMEGLSMSDARVDALVSAHLNFAREAAGLELRPVLVNGAAPCSTPLSSGKAIAALSPADQAAWTKYYLGEEVPGEAGKKALAAAVGITKK